LLCSPIDSAFWVRQAKERGIAAGPPDSTHARAGDC
jgi:hypothetical protein